MLALSTNAKLYIPRRLIWGYGRQEIKDYFVVKQGFNKI